MYKVDNSLGLTQTINFSYYPSLPLKFGHLHDNLDNQLSLWYIRH